jgi:hypothetical protein
MEGTFIYAVLCKRQQQVGILLFEMHASLLFTTILNKYLDGPHPGPINQFITE